MYNLSERHNPGKQDQQRPRFEVGLAFLAKATQNTAGPLPVHQRLVSTQVVEGRSKMK